jgi:hypothetical protein
MTASNELRYKKIPLNHGKDIPALGFGTLIQTRHRLNPVVSTGVPGFIPQTKSTAQAR